MIVKTLSRVGNSLALVLDKGVLEILDIKAKTPLKITTDGERLFVTPIKELKMEETIKASYDRFNKRYKKVFKKLSQ